MRSRQRQGSLKNSMTPIMALLMIIVSASMAYAFACYCDGYVFNSDGSAVSAGTPLNVTNLNNLENDNTTTGTGFPAAPAFFNRYKTEFDCAAGSDQVSVFATNGTHYGLKIETVPASSQAYVNITLNQVTGLLSNTTPGYKHIKRNQTTTYVIAITNKQPATDNFTLSLNSDISYAQLSSTQIINLPSGSTTTVTLTVNDTDPGRYTSYITAVSDNNPGINATIVSLTEVNYLPTISSPADNPDPVLPGNSIQLSATAIDLNGNHDTNRIIACTNNTPPVNGQCGGGTSLCDYFDAPVEASTTGQTIFCYHNVTQANGTTVTYYLAVIDRLNETSGFTAAQTFYVGTAPPAPPPAGGGGGGGGAIQPPPPEPDLCADGIQNQGETGVDCGGPCGPCPATCSDGIWNQGEFSVDCGGPCPPCETCYDGIQNQDETGVDCGGSCNECETCSDGIKNQGEEQVDCGGPCPVCATCEDEIQNQGEEQVDCGGPCLPCPPPETCSDGIQNGGEEDTDCGGPCPPCAIVMPVEEMPEEVAADVSIHDVVDCKNEVTVTKEEIKSIYNYTAYGLGEDYSIPIAIPESYVLAAAPFKTDCPSSMFNISVSVPDNLEDIKVLRCRGQNCRAVEIKQVEDPCKVSLDTGTQEPRVYEYKKEKRVEQFSAALKGTNKIVKTDDYELNFSGEDEDLNVTVGGLDENIEYPENEHLKIVGKPIVLNVTRTDVTEDEDAEQSTSMRITMPYILEEGDDPESVALYAMIKEGEETRWEFIGGKSDIILGLVEAEIDLNRYEQDGKVTIAPMTITCEDCDTAGFRNAFTPNPDTKRAVILVHGMFGTYRVWDNFINTYRTTNQPYQLWTFSYLVSKPVEENAKELANYLEINSFRYNKIDIVGYSLGGLVAQAALRYAYEENQKNANRYTFIHKVDKAILVASPSKGSPVAVEFESYITEFINDRATDYVPMNPLTLQALKEGVSVPRVPGVDYLAIAGIRSYDFLKRTGLTDRMFGEELNDGLVGVSSAQYIGDAVLDNKCVNFWERDQDHTHLIIEKNTQDLIAQMLSSRIKDALEELDRTTTLAGYTNYYEFTIDRCSPEDVYIVIGKPVAEDQIERDLLCGCGDGICAGFESAENCPTDCTHIPATVWASLAILLIILFIPFYIRLKDYLLLFVKMVKKGLAEGKTLKQIKSELEEFGYDRSILRMADKVEKLKDYDEFKIRDLLSMELTREEMKKFSGFTIIGHWVTHSLLKKPIGGREVEEAEKAFTKERKTKAAEKEPETAGEKKEETKKEEGTAEEKKEAQKGQEKTTEEKKTPEEPEQKPPAGEGKEEAKEPEVPKPKKQIIKKAVDKIAGRKSPEDLMKELERVDKDLTEAKEENEKVGFEALF